MHRVSTTPGATAFTRMPYFTYSIARLRVMASIPPFVIIGRNRSLQKLFDEFNRRAIRERLPIPAHAKGSAGSITRRKPER